MLRPVRPVARAPLGALVMAALLAACSSAAAPPAGPAESPSADIVSPGPTVGGPGATATSQPTTRPVPSDRPFQTVPPSPVPVTGEVPEAVLAAARADLATKIGAEPAAAASVILAQEVTWPDGSLDCPERGLMYIQTPTLGYHLIFEAADGRHDYRATAAGSLRECLSPPQAAP